MQKLSVMIFLSLLALGAVVGGILWGVFNNLGLFFISIGVSLGIFFSFCMLGFVLRFLFLFSSGQLDVKEPTEDEPILSETRLHLDMIAEANKIAAENKAKGKNIKPYLFLFYGWIFITIIGTLAGIALDQIFRPGKAPIYMFIGMGCFAMTILGLIIFGAVVPNAKTKIGSKRAAKNISSHKVYAIVKETSFRSATSNIGGKVTEKFMITFETPYGDSKCLCAIKNFGYGDTKADGKRLNKGDKVLIAINPSSPKYCTILKEK
jgi:hypothetical protein